MEQLSDPVAHSSYSFVNRMQVSPNCDMDSKSHLFLELMESYRVTATCTPSQDHGVSFIKALEPSVPFLCAVVFSWSSACGLPYNLEGLLRRSPRYATAGSTTSNDCAAPVGQSYNFTDEQRANDWIGFIQLVHPNSLAFLQVPSLYADVLVRTMGGQYFLLRSESKAWLVERDAFLSQN